MRAPSKSVPSKSVPSKSVPSKSVPSKSVPSKSVPSKSVPENRMVTSTPRSLLIVAAMGVLSLAVVAVAQPPQPAPADAPNTESKPANSLEVLSTEQSKVAEKYTRLEQLLIRMSELEAASNPQRAALLKRAAQQSSEKLTRQQLTTLVKLLSPPAQLKRAADEQQQVITDLKSLLELLQSENRADRLKSEQNRIKDYIKEVDRLIRLQQGVQGRTEGGDEAKKLAEDQGQLGDRTNQLLKRLDESEGGGKAKGPDESNDKDADGEAEKNAEPTPANANDKDGGKDKSKKGSGQPGDDKKGDDEKDGEKKDGNASDKSDDAKDANGDPSASKGQSGEKSSDKSKSGDKAGDPSSDQEKSDGQKSDGQKSDGGQKSQSKSKSGGQPSESEGQPSQNPADEQPEEQEPSKATPARKRLQAAEERMRDAQKKLQEAKTKDAVADQEKARQELEKAKAELEQILRQMREEEIERTLAMLEGRFRRMLESQLKIYESTKRLDKIPAAQRTRDIEIQAGKLGFEESKLAVDADKALLLLREEGSSVAFPETVELMREDMQQVADRLSAGQIDKMTQSIEEEIIQTLEELIAALQKAQQDLKDQKPQPPMQQQAMDPSQRPLVDQLAELKMIRSLQLRINTRTQRYARLLEDLEDPVGKANDADLRSSLVKLAEMEKRVHEITRNLVLGKNE